MYSKLHAKLDSLREREFRFCSDNAIGASRFPWDWPDTPAKCFPEYDLSKKVYTNALPAREFLVQLPFYDGILLQIDMHCENDDEFEETHGVRIAELLDLSRLGKIMPIIRIEEEWSPANIGDFYSPLLEMAPPTTLRFPLLREVYKQKVGVLQGAEACENRATTYVDRLVDRLWHRVSKAGLFGKSVDLRELKGITGHSLYVQLWLLIECGHDAVVQELVRTWESTESSLSVDEAHRLLTNMVDSYSSVLARHPLEAVDGQVSMNSRELLVFEHFSEKHPRTFQSFPADIGKLLVKEFKLGVCRDLAIEEIVEFSKDSENARQALFHLAEAVRNSEYEGLQGRVEAVKRIWEETTRALEKMAARRKFIMNVVPISLGILGTAGGIVNGPFGIIVGLLSAAVSAAAVSDALSEGISKCGMPNHVLSIYKLKRGATQ
ncbi:MAG: hypothetical protein NTW07_07410 [candidate division Zixibacteria bacterium]|nr:hypothetical protein [candidate division Zixibacteria bacterium]